MQTGYLRSRPIVIQQGVLGPESKSNSAVQAQGSAAESALVLQGDDDDTELTQQLQSRASSMATHEVIHYIAYSTAFQVPMLLIEPLGGALSTTSVDTLVEALSDLLEQRSRSDEDATTLVEPRDVTQPAPKHDPTWFSLLEHHALQRLCPGLHPCRTAELMAAVVAPSEQSEPTPEATYLATWINVVGTIIPTLPTVRSHDYLRLCDLNKRR